MTIYILKAYPSPHKWEADAEIIGYFTNKRHLKKAILKNWAKLGGYYQQGFLHEFFFWAERNDSFANPSQYLECGGLESVKANEF